MRSSLGQFTLGFVLAFSPAPIVGLGTYAYVHGQDAPQPAVAPTPPKQYGPPLDREFGPPEQTPSDEELLPAEASPAEPESGNETEAGPGYGRRTPQQPESQKRKPEREVPDV